MTVEEPRTPHGRLIRRARNSTIPKLSMRAAAARIGLSEERWGQVERGYKSDTPPDEVTEPSPELFASMASALEIPVSAVEAIDPEAAGYLEEIYAKRTAGVVPAAPPPAGIRQAAGPQPSTLIRHMLAALNTAVTDHADETQEKIRAGKFELPEDPDDARVILAIMQHRRLYPDQIAKGVEDAKAWLAVEREEWERRQAGRQHQVRAPRRADDHGR